MQDRSLSEAQDGHTDIDLIVDSEQQTETDVMADLHPVQVVPETLTQPLLADLQWRQTGWQASNQHGTPKAHTSTRAGYWQSGTPNIASDLTCSL